MGGERKEFLYLALDLTLSLVFEFKKLQYLFEFLLCCFTIEDKFLAKHKLLAIKNAARISDNNLSLLMRISVYMSIYNRKPRWNNIKLGKANTPCDDKPMCYKHHPLTLSI
ncbi:hypothetical protein GAMM_60105 [Gammaproteobacteria bacterium]